ncbi:hypothetical protein CROQUDRAFT_93610 [Cronartium quercuum f. sp. fusiforme G11]|uniref:Retrovirus-related Pol polyprotein from transposon TNT 1-94-like beta-barrel domain-containing protein n=1 Tax=Cronartium quercuum f. sp. fusiforme G11 TaxID=708437 RepID=A0A9P6NKC1_9BASI|nr:hypothetical protein CROQUDRAFT_93610 [Cronartium quercuum f. sp. fusiforme G11]
MSNDVAQGNATSKLTILKKGSFIRWKRHLLNHLTARELDQYILKVVPIPEETDVEARCKYRRERARVMEIIENSVDSENQQWIGITSDPKVVYNELCAQHGSSDRILTASIISQITAAKLQPGQTLSNFLNHVQGLHNTDCHRQASGTPILDKPSQKSNYTPTTNALISRLQDGNEDVKEKQLAHLVIYENESAYISYSDSEPLEHTIIADCAATKHMSGDRSLFMKLSPIAPIKITGAFGLGQPATHIGTMIVPGYQAGSNISVNIMIPNTLYCESLPVTLLSLHQLAEEGCNFHGDLDSLIIDGLPGKSSIRAIKNFSSRLWEIKDI